MNVQADAVSVRMCCTEMQEEKDQTFGLCVIASRVRPGPSFTRARLSELLSSIRPNRMQEELLKHCCSRSMLRTQTLLW